MAALWKTLLLGIGEGRLWKIDAYELLGPLSKYARASEKLVRLKETSGSELLLLECRWLYAVLLGRPSPIAAL